MRYFLGIDSLDGDDTLFVELIFAPEIIKPQFIRNIINKFEYNREYYKRLISLGKSYVDNLYTISGSVNIIQRQQIYTGDELINLMGNTLYDYIIMKNDDTFYTSFLISHPIDTNDQIMVKNEYLNLQFVL